MEEPETLDFLSMLVPFTVIIFVIAVGVVLLNQQFRKNLYKKQLEKETLKIQHQEKLLQLSLEVQENERKRIAKDLHDELGATLSISRMQLLQLERSSHPNPENIEGVRKLIETTLESTRRISHQLMPLHLESLGLKDALKSLLSEVEKTANFTTNCEVPNYVQTLPQFIQLSLYRIYSEFINNTLKYADASVIDIGIVKNDDHLFCHYSDNGVGLPDNYSKEGLGFKSIQNRIDTVKGTLAFGSSSNGFQAQFTIPL